MFIVQVNISSLIRFTHSNPVSLTAVLLNLNSHVYKSVSYQVVPFLQFCWLKRRVQFPCIIIRYLVRIYIFRCSAKSSKLFRFEVISENEHTFRSLKHRAGILRKVHEQRSSNKKNSDPNVKGEVWTVYHTGLDLFDFIFVPYV